MQQTTKYQFNLVDATDDFSPTPLNQNMEKVEEELDSLTSALTQGLGGLGELYGNGKRRQRKPQYPHLWLQTNGDPVCHRAKF